jgi:hypothetical protein
MVASTRGGLLTSSRFVFARIDGCHGSFTFTRRRRVPRVQFSMEFSARIVTIENLIQGGRGDYEGPC